MKQPPHHFEEDTEKQAKQRTGTLSLVRGHGQQVGEKIRRG
jgi:hypothetical protein